MQQLEQYNVCLYATTRDFITLSRLFSHSRQIIKISITSTMMQSPSYRRAFRTFYSLSAPQNYTLGQKQHLKTSSTGGTGDSDVSMFNHVRLITLFRAAGPYL